MSEMTPEQILEDIRKRLCLPKDQPMHGDDGSVELLVVKVMKWLFERDAAFDQLKDHLRQFLGIL